MITEEQKKLAIETFEKHRRVLTPWGINPKRACFYRSLAMFAALRELKLGKVIFQAGSASFRVVSPEKDDGVSPTHYSYEWSGWDGSGMPECHCWVVLRLDDGTDYFIDSTTQFLPELAKEKGLEWSEPKPPDVLWATVEEIPAEWSYLPVEEATIELSNIAIPILQLASTSLKGKKKK